MSGYNRTITDRLRDGAVRAYINAGGSERALAIVEAPGAYELPLLADAAARSGIYDGVVALGCVIKGETDHDRYICDAVAKALLDVGLRTGVPVAFGVLTVGTVAQAEARSGGPSGRGPGNKGQEAMAAVLATTRGIRALRAARAAAPGVRLALSENPADKSAAATPVRRAVRRSPGARAR